MVRFSRLSPAFAAGFTGQPLVLSRAVATPNREMMRFLRLASITGRRAVVASMPQDRFKPTVNPTKRNLAKLSVTNYNGGKHSANAVSFHESDGLPFTAMHCRDGTPFVDFHGELLRIAIAPPHRPAISDLTGFWGEGGAREYYPRFLALFTCFGILAESFVGFGYEGRFTEDVVVPAIAQVAARFGRRPRMVRLLPPGQELDEVWEHYPNSVLERALLAARQPLVSRTPNR